MPLWGGGGAGEHSWLVLKLSVDKFAAAAVAGTLPGRAIVDKIEVSAKDAPDPSWQRHLPVLKC